MDNCKTFQQTAYKEIAIPYWDILSRTNNVFFKPERNVKQS